MITLIAATNRKGSKTLQMTLQYQSIFNTLGHDVQILSLESLDVSKRTEAFVEMEMNYLLNVDRFVFIVPEYNGSFPGILKLMIDNSDIKNCWWNKKALLVGVADGRAGNLRGLDHLTAVLQYLRMDVYYNKLPISRINTILDEHGEWIDNQTKLICTEQIKGYLALSC